MFARASSRSVPSTSAHAPSGAGVLACSLRELRRTWRVGSRTREVAQLMLRPAVGEVRSHVGLRHRAARVVHPDEENDRRRPTRSHTTLRDVTESYHRRPDTGGTSTPSRGVPARPSREAWRCNPCIHAKRKHRPPRGEYSLGLGRGRGRGLGVAPPAVDGPPFCSHTA